MYYCGGFKSVATCKLGSTYTSLTCSVQYDSGVASNDGLTTSTTPECSRSVAGTAISLFNRFSVTVADFGSIHRNHLLWLDETWNYGSLRMISGPIESSLRVYRLVQCNKIQNPYFLSH